MIVINGINKLGINLYVGTNGLVLVGDCEDENGNFNYHAVKWASAHILDTDRGGCNVLISKKEYDKLKKRKR